MNVESVDYSPKEGAAPSVDVSDVEMVAVLDSSGAKTMRNVQTQHGDYRSVDEENTFLISRCLWPDDDKGLSSSQATTSSDNSASASGSGGSGSSSGGVDQPAIEEPEQVVWIEPFANEVSAQLLASYLVVKTIVRQK